MQIPTRAHESGLSGRIAQIDEVGRGALSGPVCAGAVVLPEILPDDLAGIRDSKRISARKRERYAARIAECCECGIGLASVEEINAVGILKATFLAMERAVAALPARPDAILVDGDALPPTLPYPGRAVIDGDALCTGIAAASIIAKVHRDAIMHRLAEDFPYFGWDSNAGYGAARHLNGLQMHGHTAHHRMTFRGVKGTKPYVAPLF